MGPGGGYRPYARNRPRQEVSAEGGEGVGDATQDHLSPQEDRRGHEGEAAVDGPTASQVGERTPDARVISSTVQQEKHARKRDCAFLGQEGQGEETRDGHAR